MVREIMFKIMMKTEAVTVRSNKEEPAEYVFYYKPFLESFQSAISSKDISKLNISQTFWVYLQREFL